MATNVTQEVEGFIAQILGGVVDVAFPPGAELPEIYDAIRVPRDGQEDLILEVQQHLGNGRVRCVSMDTTDGLQRGIPAFATGAPILVPVGEAVLGRVFNVLGRPIDGKGPVQADTSQSAVLRRTVYGGRDVRDGHQSNRPDRAVSQGG